MRRRRGDRAGKTGTTGTPSPEDTGALTKWWTGLTVLQQFGTVTAIVVMFGLAGLISYNVYVGTIPSFKNPSWADAILASRIVIAAVRIAVVAACIFVCVSVLAHVSRGRWLSVVGPVKLQESVNQVSEATADYSQLVEDAQQTIKELEGKLTETDAELKRLNTRLGHMRVDRDEAVRQRVAMEKELSKLQQERRGG